MKKMDDWWDGYLTALLAMEVRVENLRSELDGHSKAVDLILDISNEIKDMKVRYPGLTQKG